MAEFEELRLTVTLVDNATAGLTKLRQDLRALGGGDSRDAITKMQREIEQLSSSMGRMREHAARTSAGVTALSRTIGGAITGFATAFVSQFALDSLRKFTDELVRLDGLSKQIGVGGAQIKSLVDQMRLMGIDANAATAAVSSFATALAELSREGSEIRNELIKGAPNNVGLMQAFIARITGFASKGEMANAMQETIRAADSVFQEEMKRTGGNEIMAAELRNRFLSTLKLDPATMALIKGQLREVTEAEKAEYARRSAIAQAFTKEMNVLDLKGREFIQGLQVGLLPIMRDVNAAIGTMGEKWGEAIGKDVSDSLAKLIDQVKFLYGLVTNPGATIKEALSAQAAQASPGLQGVMRGLGFDVPTTEENRKYWEEQNKRGTAGKYLTPEEQEAAEKRHGIEWVPVPKKMSYGGGVGSSQMPQLIRASLGGGQPITMPGASSGGGGAQQQLARAVRSGVYDALIDFRNFMQAGGGGLVQRASLGGGGPYGGSAGTGGGNVGPGPYGSNVGPGSGKGAGESPATSTTPGGPPGPGQTGSGAAGTGALFDPITGKLGGGLGEPRPGGRRHQGDDISAPVGTAVHASKDGVVERVGTDNWGTPVVTVRHPDGTYSRYMHLSTVGVKAGDKLKGGQELGKSGTANNVPHLHYEIWHGKPNAPGSRMLNPREVHGWNNKTNQPQAQRAVPGTGDQPPATAKAPENAPAKPQAAAPEVDPHAGHDHSKPSWPRTLPVNPPAPAAVPPADPAAAPGVGVDDSKKGRVAGLQAAMAEVKEAGLETTSGYRDPSHKLSRANPSSAHITGLAFDTRARTTAQVDAAMAKQRALFASHGLVEGRDYTFKDEVRRPAGHATGPHLHTQFTPEGMRRYQQSQVARANQRKTLDADLGQEIKSRTTATGKLTAEVKAPPGAKVDVSGDGAFKKTETNRSTPLPTPRERSSGGEEAVAI